MDMIEVMKKVGERTTGDRIALLMRERGKRQYELAQHLNKSASFVSQIVNDERGMTPEDAAKVARPPHCDPPTLIVSYDSPTFSNFSKQPY